MADHCQSRECISFAGIITLGFNEGRYKIGGVGNESFGGLVDRGYSEDGIFSDIGVPMLEARSGGA